MTGVGKCLNGGEEAGGGGLVPSITGEYRARLMVTPPSPFLKSCLAICQLQPSIVTFVSVWRGLGGGGKNWWGAENERREKEESVRSENDEQRRMRWKRR